jgi:anti-sigma B factor antagonist
MQYSLLPGNPQAPRPDCPPCLLRIDKPPHPADNHTPELGMTIDTRDHGGIKIVRPYGDLRGEDAALIKCVTDLLTGPGTRVVLDLRNVPFMNSAGLGTLVRLVAQANTQECRVVLADLTPFIAGALNATGLDRFFEIIPTTDDAIRKLCNA